MNSFGYEKPKESTSWDFVKNITKRKLNREEIIVTKEDEININKIRRKGGIAVQPSYVYCNGKYVTALRVHTFDDKLKDFWLSKYTFFDNMYIKIESQIERKETIINKEDARSEFAAARAKGATRMSSRISNAETLNESKKMIKRLGSDREGVNSVSLTFIVFDDTHDGLTKRIGALRRTLANDRIKAAISLNKVMDDVILTKFNNNTKNIMTSSTASSFFPFNFQDINDPKGTYFGTTRRGKGAIVLDHFRLDGETQRNTYDIMIMGKKRSGKSTLSKNIIKKELLMGNKQIIFDPEAEYVDFARYLGGKIINPMSSDAVANPLEFRTKEEEVDFNSNLNELSIFLKTFNPELNYIELQKFLEAIKVVYGRYGIKKRTDTSQFTNTDFPLFIDVLALVNLILKGEELKEAEYQQYEKIKYTLESIVDDYGDIFNKHSNLDISNDDLIVFNFKKIEDMAQNVKDALIYTFFKVHVDKIINENKKYNDSLTGDEPRRYVRITLDESHLFLNEANPEIVKWFKSAIKRIRKYYGGIMLLTQSILDVIFESTSMTAIDLKAIWQEMTYRYMMYQDLEGGKFLWEAVEQLTNQDIDNLTKFKTGEALLLLPQQKIQFKHFITSKEDELMYKTENFV